MRRDYKGINIYHYTDFIALDGILNGEGFRLCDIRFMNDGLEIKQFLSMLQCAVNENLINRGKKGLIENVEKLFKQEIDSRLNSTLYASCFSEYKDDAAQWERYGNNGMGVMIELNAELLREIISGVVILQTVFYKTDVSNHDLVQIITDYIVNPKKPIGGFNNIKGVFDNVWACSGAFKHSSFKSEKEIRMLSIPFAYENFLGTPRFTVRGDKIGKYYSIDIKQLCKDNNLDINQIITGITIGPKSTQSVENLKEFLTEKGLESLVDSIYKSTCPLR